MPRLGPALRAQTRNRRPLRRHGDCVDPLLFTSNAPKNMGKLNENREVATPLHWATTSTVDDVETSLKRGANPDAKDIEGKTPLHWAAAFGKYSVAELLLQYGANPDAEDDGGMTPLHIAAITGNYHVAELLLRYGAKPNARNMESQTPLHVVGGVRTAKVLLGYGADPGARDVVGNTPLHYAYLEVAKILIERVPVDVVNSRRQTPLHMAAWRENVDLVEFLLQHGASPNAADERGETPLYYIVKKCVIKHAALVPCKTSIIHLLLDYGAVPMRDGCGKLPTEFPDAIVRTIFRRRGFL